MVIVHSCTNYQVVTDAMCKDLSHTRVAFMQKHYHDIYLRHHCSPLHRQGLRTKVGRRPLAQRPENHLLARTNEYEFMNVKKEVIKEEVKITHKKACETDWLKGIMKFTMKQLVSSRIIDLIIYAASIMVLPNPDRISRQGPLAIQ